MKVYQTKFTCICSLICIVNQVILGTLRYHMAEWQYLQQQEVRSTSNDVAFDLI